MRRFFAENMELAGDTVVLTGDEARHVSIVISHLIGYLKTRTNAPQR